jgi:basic membrane protein A and related proteins
VGVVHVAPVAEIGWTKQHSLAVEALQAQFGDRVEISVVDNVFDPQHAEQVFRELARAGIISSSAPALCMALPCTAWRRSFPM